MKLVLPLPPSANTYWRSIIVNGKIRVLLSKQGRVFKERCGLIALMQRAHVLKGDVSVRGVVYFQDRRRDLDNVCKPLLDGLKGVAYDDDRQVRHIELTAEIDAKNPRVEIELKLSA